MRYRDKKQQQQQQQQVPLYGFIQLIDYSLQHGLVGGDVWSVEASSEEG